MNTHITENPFPCRYLYPPVVRGSLNTQYPLVLPRRNEPKPNGRDEKSKLFRYMIREDRTRLHNVCVNRYLLRPMKQFSTVIGKHRWAYVIVKFKNAIHLLHIEECEWRRDLSRVVPSGTHFEKVVPKDRDLHITAIYISLIVPTYLQHVCPLPKKSAFLLKLIHSSCTFTPSLHQSSAWFNGPMCHTCTHEKDLQLQRSLP